MFVNGHEEMSVQKRMSGWWLVAGSHSFLQIFHVWSTIYKFLRKIDRHIRTYLLYSSIYNQSTEYMQDDSSKGFK
jgi:hypothetical protein